MGGCCYCGWMGGAEWIEQCWSVALPARPLCEEHEEGEHEGEESNGLGEGEAQNGVVEQHTGQVGLTGAGDEEVTEDGSDSESDTSEGDSGEAGTDVVEALDGDGNGGGGAGGDDAGGGGGHSGTADGGGTDTAHHLNGNSQ